MLYSWWSVAILLRWKTRDFHIFSWLVFIILGICPNALGEKPLLIPTKDELLIQEGNELRIKCYSEQTRLQFSFPKYTFSSPRSPHKILPPKNGNGTWTFLRRNAVALDTGWYACAAEGVEIENHFNMLNHTQENIAWIYVYVNSSEPFADRYYIFPKMITILNGNPGIVPCRPTSPDLVVQLWKNYRIIDDNEYTSYDPKIGFIVEPPSRWNSKSVFHCKINGIEDEYILQYSNVKSRRPHVLAFLVAPHHPASMSASNLVRRLSRVGKELLHAEMLDEEKYNCVGFTHEQYQQWVMTIHNLTFEDAGLYTVDFTVFEGSHPSVRINITLDIKGPPTVSMQNESAGYFTPPGAVFRIHSNMKGSPRSNLTWTFTKYPNFPSYKDSHSTIILNYTEVFVEKYTSFSNLTMSTAMSGILTCIACNFFNCSKHIFPSDVIGHFGIIGPLEKVYIGDDVTLTCVGSIFKFQNLSWHEESDKSSKIANQETLSIVPNITQYSIQRVLTIKNVTDDHRKSFICLGKTITGNNETTMYYLNPRNPEKPSIIRTTLNMMYVIVWLVKINSTIYELSCCAFGEPAPIISWLKDGIPLNDTSEYEIEPCKLVIHLDSHGKKSGRYTFRAENRFGQAEDYLDFYIGEERAIETLAPYTATVLIFILALIVWLVIRKRCAKMSRLRLQEEILKRFEKGALDYLDPNLDVADQAEVLPYDKIWEYPRDSLKFGKILGSGAFGIVRRAEAKSIRPGESFTTVAVKMVRATSTLHQMTALARELKVLIHLGQHINIINLLGACTKNISYGELFVIVEFCRFGNFKDYLSRRRADFIDQVDPVTGEINAPDLSIGNVSVHDNDNGANGSIDCDGISVAEGSCCSQDSTHTNAEEIPCEASVELGFSSKYDGDYADNILVPIRTRDLLCWAWQVSRGMRFLGARKVVHGDLAARNILLADNNVVKICDLGLAKAILNQDHYNKEEDEPLPVKWMAIEALRDRRFSIESDVWSFGIVLWEFFTLAQSPYPEIHAGHIYQKLVDGYRLDKPKYAPKNMYRLMMNCWEAEPSKRPSFKLIETLIDELLDDSVKGDYLDSGNEYCSYMKSVKKDYLTMDLSLDEIESTSTVTYESDPKPSTLDTNETLV